MADGSDFEAASTWSVGNQASAAVQSNGTTDPASSGAFSLKVTKNANTPGALAVNGNTDIPVVASIPYVVTFQFYTLKASVTYNVNIDWYAGGTGTTYVSSTVTGTATAVQGVNTPPYDNRFWSAYPAQTVTPPATTTFARLNVQMVSGLTTGDIVFIDNVFVGRLLVPAGRLVMPQAVNRASTR
ncbi:hypothetical protein [Streptomyces sp. NBC_00687]|uniref:hypothetical protein n=1 Tax=Streptomyces sp. NBC_00687 TaxID=2975807 RepID=UPI002258F9E3|nr:hypothetical protein [Streptomyces sp. NBC_00687]MCX4912820.1 hypothetical protein [Streptomyces sp. NBC_00687]